MGSSDQNDLIHKIHSPQSEDAEPITLSMRSGHSCEDVQMVSRHAIDLDFWMVLGLKIPSTLELRWIRSSLPSPLAICQGKQQLQFEVVRARALVEHLPEAKLAFDDPKGMLNFGAEVGFRRLNQFQKSVL